MALSLKNTPVSRRQLLRLVLGGACYVVAASQVGCSSEAPAPAPSQDSAPAQKPLDREAFDALIEQAPLCAASDIAANSWAKKIADAGVLHLGNTKNSTLFSFLDDQDNEIRGFDAGLAKMFCRYLLGDSKKFVDNEVQANTRESLLMSGQDDIIWCTYSITPERQKSVSFAGPYFTTRQSLLVMNSNSSINSLADLAGKNVAAQSGSVGPVILSEACPDAQVQEFTSDEEARTALEQGRVDAYSMDKMWLMSDMVKNPGKYKLAGDEFGPEDNYGVGLPKDSDAVQFVNTFLKRLYATSLRDELWKITIGDRVGVSEVPAPPAIAE